MPPVLVTFPVDDALRAQLADVIGSSDVRFAVAPSESDLSWCEIIFGNASLEALRRSPRIRWLHSPSVGLDAYDGLWRDRPELELTNAPHVMDDAVAEHAISMLLALTRQVPLLVRSQDRHEWARTAYATGGHGQVVTGKTAVVVGYGSIARSLIDRLVALRMSVIALRRDPHSPEDALRFAPYSAILDEAARADVLVNLVRSSPETRGLIGASVIDRLPPSAIVVSVGRGAVIDEAALTAALRAGKLHGAALDVFESEPLPASSELWDLPNVLISPHVAGRFAEEASLHVARFVAEYRLRHARDGTAGSL